MATQFSIGGTGGTDKKPTCLTTTLLVLIPVLFAAALLAIFMTVPEIPPVTTHVQTKCILSSEANRTGLSKFFQKLQDAYFHELHPDLVAIRPGVTTAEVRTHFSPYDPEPSSIKRKTIRAGELLQDLENIRYNETELKLRERVAYYIGRNVLRGNFGWAARAQNYYVGDWMLGPDTFCWEPICNLVIILQVTLPHFAPHNISDARKLREVIMKHNDTAEQYIENMRAGWRAGMVRSQDGCEDGLHAIKYGWYEPITLKGGKGILDSPLVNMFKSGFFQHLSATDNKTWEEVYEEDVEQYFINSLVDYVGTPIYRILKFLEDEHSRRCVKPSLSAGFGSLPVNFEYLDGNVDRSRPTTKVLPDGTKLQGKESYKALLPFFASTLITPEEVEKQARNRLQKEYDRAVEIAKLYTFQNDNKTAVAAFKRELLKKDRAINSEDFPLGESNEKAFVDCRNDALAKKNCPKRWSAMQEWIKSTKASMEVIRPKLDDLFYSTGNKKTTPDCPISVMPYYVPTATFHSYETAMTSACSEFTAVQRLPFFAEKFGPKYTEWSTTAREQLPGHHLEVQGFNELFADTCGDPVGWLFHTNYIPAFTQGWAVYAEGSLLSRDTDLYSNTNDRDVLMQKYGMVHHQILEALRALVEIEMGYNGKSRDDALKLYEQYAWQDNTHMAQLDVKRYQSIAGYSVSYLLGEMEILRVRAMVEKELGPDFSLKEFHYQLLRFGEYPLDYMEKYFRYYISCKKGLRPMSAGCIEALS